MRAPAPAIALIAGLAIAAPAALQAAPEPHAPDLDVLIAIDTTGSMTPSIQQAKRDARQVVADTQSALPGARFAVAQFRDAGDRPPYELVQPMTGDPDLVSAAMQGLFADGGGDTPEAYGTVFRRAAAGDGIGWRPGARRLLVVIGDAEPHGAGTAGLAGCADASADPLGVPVKAALAELRAAQVSLAMILQAGSASTSLECYRSIANAAYGQGSARASGGGTGPVTSGPGGGVEPERTTTGGAPGAAPAPALRTALRDAIRGSLPRARLVRRPGEVRVMVTNPTGDAVRVDAVRLRLPPGARLVAGSWRGLAAGPPARAGGALVWRPGASLAPGAGAVLRVRVRGPLAGTRAGADFAMPGGARYTA